MPDTRSDTGALIKWHGVKPEFFHVKKELLPGLAVDYDEKPANGEVIFRFGGKEQRHPIEPGKLAFGRYAVDIVQDTFLAALDQFTFAVTLGPCADEDFAKLKPIASGAPSYCTPWMGEEELGLCIAAPARVAVADKAQVVVAMMCQIKRAPDLPPLPPSPTLVFTKKDTGAVLRRTVVELQGPLPAKPAEPAKPARSAGKGKPDPAAPASKATFTEFFNVDVGSLLKPGAYGIAAVFGPFESTPVTVTIGPAVKASAAAPLLVPIAGDAGTTKVTAGPFHIAIRHRPAGDLVDYAVVADPQAKVDLLDGTSLGPTPVRFRFGRRVTFRLVDRTRELRQLVTVVVSPG